MVKDNEKGSPLTGSIKQMIKDVKNALGPNEEVSGAITLELSTVIEGKLESGLSIQVVKLGSNVNSQEVQKMTIPIRILNETERAKKLIELDSLWNSDEYKRAIERHKRDHPK